MVLNYGPAVCVSICTPKLSSIIGFVLKKLLKSEYRNTSEHTFFKKYFCLFFQGNLVKYFYFAISCLSHWSFHKKHFIYLSFGSSSRDIFNCFFIFNLNWTDKSEERNNLKELLPFYSTSKGWRLTLPVFKYHEAKFYKI